VAHRDHSHELQALHSAHVERRTKEGLSKKEIIRVLKRYVAREVSYHPARGNRRYMKGFPILWL
jgi:hypothetical protein